MKMRSIEENLTSALRQSHEEGQVILNDPVVWIAKPGFKMTEGKRLLPALSSCRQITTGDGNITGPGEVVALSYDMFSWSTGEMVESSLTAVNGPLMYCLGGDDTPIHIPVPQHQS